MALGYTGKILNVNLTDLTHEIEEKGDYFYRTFMGGSAMASYFLLTEMEPGVDALGPDNVLVLTTSVLTGTPLPGANRYTLAAKSPLNDGFGEAEAGGFFSYQFKTAGFDAIVIKGKAPKPVYLWITNGKLEVPVTHQIPAVVMGSGLGRSHVSSGDYDITLFCEETVEEYGLEDLRLGDLVAIVDADHSYGRIYRKGSISVSIVTHSDCITAGHGPGTTTLFTSKTGAIKPKIDPNANIAKLMRLRDDL